MSVVWITHDLALIAGLADRVAVLYAGTVVEDAPVDDLFARRRIPTRAACSPRSRRSPTRRRAACPRSAARRRNRGAGPRLPVRAALRDGAGGLHPGRSEARAAVGGRRPPGRVLRGRSPGGGRLMQGEALIRIENLRKHFHVRLGAFGGGDATVYALDDVSFEIVEGETLSLGGRERLRQVHDGLRDPEPAQAIGGQGGLQGAGHRRARRQGDAAVPARSADRVPGSLFDAETAHDRGRGGGRADPPHKLAPKSALAERLAQLLADVGCPSASPALSARTLRWSAPAGGDRPRARLRAEVHRLRRGHLRAGRLDPERRSSTCCWSFRWKFRLTYLLLPTISRWSATSRRGWA